MNFDTSAASELTSEYEQDSRLESESEQANPANITERPLPHLPPARR